MLNSPLQVDEWYLLREIAEVADNGASARR